MKRYLLDTSLFAGFLHKRAKAIELLTPWIRNHEVATSILVYGEVIGLEHDPKSFHHGHLAALLIRCR